MARSYPKIKILTIYLSFLFLSVTLGQPPTLSFSDCLRRAQEVNFSVKAQQFRQKALEQRFWFEQARSRPQLFGEVGLEDHRLSGYGFGQQWFLLNADWALGNWLYTPFKGQKAQAQAAREMGEWDRLHALEKAARFYIRLLQKEKEYRLLSEQYALLQLHHKVARALWQAGSKSELDVLQTRAEILKIREKMQNTLEFKKALSRELSVFLGLSPTDSLQLMYLNTQTICAQPLPSVDDSLVRANPMLRSLQWQIRAQKWKTREARARRLPHVFGAGGYFVDHDPTGDGNYWLARVGVQIPLFLWNETRFQEQAARATEQSLTQEMHESQRTLHMQLVQMLTRLKQLKQSLKIQARRLNTLQKMLDLAQSNYRAGLTTNLEFLNMQQQWTEAKIVYQTTELDFVLALVEFYTLTNQPEKIFTLAR